MHDCYDETIPPTRIDLDAAGQPSESAVLLGALGIITIIVGLVAVWVLGALLHDLVDE